MNTAHEETYKGCTLKLVHDDSPESPREWGNVGTMVCWHRHYNLGDEQPKCDPDEYLERIACNHDERLRFWVGMREAGWYRYCEKDQTMLRINRHFQEHLKRVLDEHFIILPLYLYDHSGLTMSTGAFSCPWDSGQVGFIYCTMERARKEWGEKYNPGITDAEIRKKATACLENEVETYAAYLEGNVVGFVTEDPEGNEIDSCWGFYPEGNDYAYAMSQARDSIDHWCEKQEVDAIERAHWEARGTVTT